MSDDEIAELWKEILLPKFHDWIFVVLHCTVFVIGLIGNFLVLLVVYRNQSMRTVTDYCIVNLAIADILVICICLPPTVIWDVTKNWYLGNAMCKIVLYFQDVSVSVSVYSLTFISLDRWKAICRPLESTKSIKRTVYILALIWILSLIVLSPDLVYLETRPQPDLQEYSQEYYDCYYSWSLPTSRIHQVLIVIFLYFLPLSFMSYAYYKIGCVLWNKNIPGCNEITSSNGYRNTNSNRFRFESKYFFFSFPIFTEE